jgi:hypothetical protein
MSALRPGRDRDPSAVEGAGTALRHAFRAGVIGRVVYGTISVMSVLIVYDGWSRLELRGVLGVIVGPVVAMFVSHIFSSALAQQVDLRRNLTGSEMIATIRSESRFLLLALPPVLLAVVTNIAGAALTTSVQVILWVGVASLGFWGGLAGRRAGFSGWHLVLATAAGLLVGLTVLALQVFLQPGTAANGGSV